MSFTPLRNHTHYSLLRALPEIKQLIKKAVAHNHTAIAITDKNNMYGAIEFYKECKKNNIKPILGVELTIKSQNIDYAIVMLAKNYNSYKNMMRIVSAANIKDKNNKHSFLTTNELIELKNKDMKSDIG
ncbi:MAG: PHP domain-containing protein [Cyanobium sp. MAG06]|nr:PHP domain-containing protein [Cyanobium sp. MAG06]